MAGAVTVVALPAVLGYGRRADNPSVLPQAYGTHLVTIVILIGLVTGAVAVLNAYARLMGKAILTIVGVLLAIWLIFMVIGMIISALKALIWIGFLAVIAAIVRVLERPDHATSLCAGTWLALVGAVAMLAGSWWSISDERTSLYEPATPEPRRLSE